MNVVNVLLVDDHAVVRSGMARLLERYELIHIVAEADSGEQAYQCYIDHNPDLVIMDMSMPGIGGLEALRRIITRQAEAKVIMFSMHENINFAVQAMTAGAVGYVAKSGDAQDLINAVKQVIEGKNYLSADIAQKIALHNMSGQHDPVHKLTAREFEVFRLLAEGRLIDEIAELLSIGQKTAANYQTTLKQKLGIQSSVELVRLALKYELIN
jgi:DNA-binding NarL/FixJ family response regulator